MLKGMFCMRLHTAGMLIGWLGSVCGFISVIILSIALGNADYIAERIATNDPLAQEAAQKLFVLGCSIALAVVALGFLSSIMLIIGTMKNHHLFLMPWLINSGIFLVVTIIGQLLQFCLVTQSGFLPAFVFLIFSALILTFKCYIYYAIYSLFDHIRAIREEKRTKIVENEGNHNANSYPTYVKI